ncbi:MAG: DNA primase [Coxiellaceae bacterium]|jgi:DNA primase|nr:DNA primase [Coxiellaceae bacterium]
MSKLIPQTFIDDLLTRTDIVDIVSSRVKLRRTGSNLVGLCPFHTEKTPSFTVSPNKQFFHCFGCGAHGNSIGFIMQFEHLNFIETIENLASQVDLTVPETSGRSNEARHTELYDLTEKITTFFEQQLPHSPRAISYLKSRGLNGEICKKFRVGYAPNDWDNLNSIYRSSSVIKQHMLTTGFLATKNNKFYSRFRDRVMFPIQNVRGHIIGFGGRTIDNDPAKYLNSPETPIFHKGEELYGLHAARKATPNLKFIIVVEGYLDVISLAQFGITNAVATLGTAISTKQIQLLLRHTSEIVFCFDGDSAGRTAAWRALENSLPIMRDGIQIKFLFLPEEHDPDTLIRKESKEKFNQRLESAVPLSDFFINHLESNININTIDGKAKLTKISKEWLKKMPLGIFRQLLSSKIAKLVNINVEELDIENTMESPQNAQVIDPTIASTTPNIPIPIENTINILLHYPESICHIEDLDRIKNIKLNGIEILSELIYLLKQQPNISMGAILEYWRDRQEFNLLNKLACKEPIIPKEILKNELIGTIQLLKKLEQETLIQALLAKASTEKLKIEERQKLQDLITLSKSR